MEEYQEHFKWWVDLLKDEDQEKVKRFEEKLNSFKTEDEFSDFIGDLRHKSLFREFSISSDS